MGRQMKVYKAIITGTVLSGLCVGTIFGQTTLAPTATFLGYREMERIGYWVQYAGDVNGDGYDDFLCGNNHSWWNGWDSGAAYLILGRGNPNWGPNFHIEDVDAYFTGGELDAAGYALGGGGDVNGDGYDDFLIGAPAGREQAGPRPGHAFLMFGKANPDWGANFRLFQRADVSFKGEYSWDMLGLGLAIVGDVNGDGYDDMVFGSVDNDQGGDLAGKAYLVLGRADGWPPLNTNINDFADASFYSTVAVDGAGYTIAGPGDVNGDGYDDILIGAFKRPGRAYMIFGRAAADWGLDNPLQDADVIFTEEIGGSAGGFTLDGGDVNGDGINDVLIGAPDKSTGVNQNGKIYIFFGKTSGWDKWISMASSDGSFIGEHKYDHVGNTKSLASGFDINLDGCDDLLIGAPENDQAGLDAGKAYLIYGKRSGWQNDVKLNQAAAAQFFGEDTVSYTGMGLNFVGDVNNDGLVDIAISAPLNRNRAYRSGKLYLFVTESDNCSISGRVLNVNNDNPVPNVQIEYDNGSVMNATTNAAGEYSFVAIPKGNSVVTPAKSKGEDVGSTSISAYDAALTAQDAIGLIDLSSGQKATADVDKDGTVTMLDAALILRFSVGISSNPVCDAGTWLFTPESRTYLNQVATLQDQDFHAWVIGDVDGNWSAPSGAAGKAAGEKSVIISGEPIPVVPGERFTVMVPVAGNSGMIAGDFIIEYNPEKITFRQAGPASLTKDFTLLYSEDNAGTVRLGMMNTKAVWDEGDIVELQFTSSADFRGDAVVRIDRYSINGKEGDPLEFRIESQAWLSQPETVELGQNYPNPFNPVTTIPYYVAETGQVRLTIINLLGRTVRTLVNGTVETGFHTVEWDGNDAAGKDAGTGMFICRIDLGSRSEIIKLIKVK